ncbi:NAD-dependent epimerase/dehydratase family protein [bacterium]|nr:NAD-dependent epimerase/dehydratase family protein [bacterium]
MKVFVTGGGGFLGSVICRKLLENGHEVISFSRNPHEHLGVLGIMHKQGSITNLDSIIRAGSGCDAMIHTAAKAGVWGSLESYYEPNVVGTENVIATCRKHKIEKLVFTSSPSVIFNGNDMENVDESVPYPTTFEAPYPQTKALAEKAVLAANCQELATVALRPHLIWGPGDPHLVSRIVNRGQQGKLRRIGKDIKHIDSVYIDNAADAHVLALEQLEPSADCAGKAYFITNGEPVPTWQLVNRILDCAGIKPVDKTISTAMAMKMAYIFETVYRLFKSEKEPRLTRFVVRELSTSHWFDISAAKKDLGYFPKISLDEGFVRLREGLEGGKDPSPLPIAAL